MKVLKTGAGLLMFVAVLGTFYLYSLTEALEIKSAQASPQVDVWWPVDRAHVSGTQPFKAMLPHNSVENYRMYWQVDGDSWNPMEDSYEDWPHKSSIVDLHEWNWKGQGPYEVNFIATDHDGNVIAERSVSITVGGTAPEEVSFDEQEIHDEETVHEDSKQEKSPRQNNGRSERDTEQQENVTQEESSQHVEQVYSTDNPFTGASLYVDPNSPARHHANALRGSNPHGAAMLDKIASQSGARWFGGWNADIYGDVREMTQRVSSAGAVPVYIAYNIPARDCGSYSAGGAGSPDGYRAWVRDFARGIGSNKAVVILEPDALAGMDCLSRQDQETRMNLLSDAVNIFNAQGNVSVYIDAGHAHWIGAEEMASRLRAAGVEQARGFALNVSNYFTTGDNVRYGERLNAILGKNFVIDTSRNGLGATSDHQWCNPPGRALGERPTTNTGHGAIDAYLWLKVPGESDGTCNGGPSAGHFWVEYAIGLAERASW